MCVYEIYIHIYRDRGCKKIVIGAKNLIENLFLFFLEKFSTRRTYIVFVRNGHIPGSIQVSHLVMRDCQSGTPTWRGPGCVGFTLLLLSSTLASESNPPTKFKIIVVYCESIRVVFVIRISRLSLSCTHSTRIYLNIIQDRVYLYFYLIFKRLVFFVWQDIFKNTKQNVER